MLTFTAALRAAVAGQRELGDEKLSAGNFLPSGGHLPVRFALLRNRGGGSGGACVNRWMRRGQAGWAWAAANWKDFSNSMNAGLCCATSWSSPVILKKPRHAFAMLNHAQNACRFAVGPVLPDDIVKLSRLAGYFNLLRGLLQLLWRHRRQAQLSTPTIDIAASPPASPGSGITLTSACLPSS